jgi:hypothetical protein
MASPGLDGKDYPPSVLLGWKAAHEFRIAREHGAVLGVGGQCTEITVGDIHSAP